MVSLHKLLEEIVQQNASDLHLTAGVPPQFRVDGELRAAQCEPLQPDQTEQLIYSVLREDQRKRFELNKELDLSFGIKGLAASA